MNSRLSTSIDVGRKERGLYSAPKKVDFVHCRRFHSFVNGSSGYRFIWFYLTNEPTFYFETSTNQSYPIALEIIFYLYRLIAFAVKSPIIPYTQRHIRVLVCFEPESDSKWEHMDWFGSIWITPRPFSVFHPG